VGCLLVESSHTDLSGILWSKRGLDVEIPSAAKQAPLFAPRERLFAGLLAASEQTKRVYLQNLDKANK
jgi:hypothetical protein